VEIEQIAIKMAKVKRELAAIQKAGTQAKSLARIGEQNAVGLIPHQSVDQKVSHGAAVNGCTGYCFSFFQESSDPDTRWDGIQKRVARFCLAKC